MYKYPCVGSHKNTNTSCSLTLCICGAAYDLSELGLEACVGGAVLASRLVPPGAQRQHTLQRRVWPQTLTFVDGQRCGVVYQEASVLEERRDKGGKGEGKDTGESFVSKYEFIMRIKCGLQQQRAQEVILIKSLTAVCSSAKYLEESQL